MSVPKMNCAELTEKVNELCTQYSTVLTELESVRSIMADMEINHANKLAQVQKECDQKMHDMQIELNATIKARANSTLDYYKLMDEKIDTQIIKIDILDGQRANQEKTLNVVKKDVSDLNAQYEAEMNNKNAGDERDSTETVRNKRVSLESLESRIDKLEDYSRRDNLLFSGFEEEEKENCENKVRDLLARKIFIGERNINVNNIVIVRAHRLGRYKAGNTRPIIVKFREFSDKQLILQQVYKGKLINTGKWATEDFSVNTTEDRKYLREHLNAAKEVLKGKIKSSSIRYKAIHVANTSGSRFVFPLHKVEKNSQTWWKVIGAEGDTHQYPEGASRPEDIQDIVEEAPADDAEHDSDGTQNSVEQPKEVAVPTTTAEEGKVP